MLSGRVRAGQARTKTLLRSWGALASDAGSSTHRASYPRSARSPSAASTARRGRALSSRSRTGPIARTGSSRAEQPPHNPDQDKRSQELVDRYGEVAPQSRAGSLRDSGPRCSGRRRVTRLGRELTGAQVKSFDLDRIRVAITERSVGCRSAADYGSGTSLTLVASASCPIQPSCRST